MSQVTDSTSVVALQPRPTKCGPHCGRFVHFHPEDTLPGDLYKMGEITLLYGLVMVRTSLSPSLNVAPDLKSQVVSRVLLGGTGIAAAWVGPGLFTFAAGTAYVGEKIYQAVKSGMMELTSQDVRESESQRLEQQRLFGKFQEGAKQLRVLTDDVLPALSSEVDVIQQGTEEGLRTVERMKALYEQNQEVFEEASRALVLVEGILTAPRTVIEHDNFELQVTWLHQIEQERGKTRLLDSRIETLRQDVAEKRARLLELQRQTVALNTVESMQYDGIQEDVRALETQDQLKKQYEPKDGILSKSSPGVLKSYV